MTDLVPILWTNFEKVTMAQSFLLQRDRKKKNDKSRERKEKAIKERETLRCFLPNSYENFLGARIEAMVSRVLKNEHQQLITPTTPWASKQCLCVLKERGGCSPQPTTYPEIVGFLQNSTPLENNTLLVYPQHLPKETWRSPPSYTYRMSEASRAWGGGGAA